MWDYIIPVAWGVVFGWFMRSAWLCWRLQGKHDLKDIKYAPQKPLSSSEYSFMPYEDFANQPWRVHGIKDGNERTVKYRELDIVLLMDIRAALWETRDAVEENTAYLKRVYGDPDGGG